MKASEGVRQANLGNLAGDKAQGLSEAIREGMKDPDKKKNDLELLLKLLENTHSVDELLEKFPELTKNKLEELLTKAMEEGLIFESSSGHYDLVL